MVTRRGSAGFTVLECVVALAVVAVISGALLAAGPLRVRGAAQAFRASAALRLAQGDLERARAERATIAPGTTSRPIATDALAAPTITRVVSSRADGMLQVHAEVSWEEPGGEASSVYVVTLLAPEGSR